MRYGFEAIVRNEFDSRQYDPDLILQSLSGNGTTYIINTLNSNASSFNTTGYTVLDYPQVNPMGMLGFNVGMWRCLVILAGLTIALRITSVICLKVLVSKFQ